jgi:hypothetical protein
MPKRFAAFQYFLKPSTSVRTIGVAAIPVLIFLPGQRQSGPGATKLASIWSGQIGGRAALADILLRS